MAHVEHIGIRDSRIPSAGVPRPAAIDMNGTETMVTNMRHDDTHDDPTTRHGDGETDIEGLTNFRELGGLELAGGGETRHGILARSEGLVHVQTQALSQLHDMGVTCIVDLRSDAESESAPDPQVPGATMVRIPLLGGDMLHRDLKQWNAIKDMTAEDILHGMYFSMIAQEGRALTRAVRTIAHVDGDGMALVHCTAGKDRTGLAVALALDAAGVRREAIIEDYALSHTMLSGVWETGVLSALAARNIRIPDNIEPLLTMSPAPLMNDVLDDIDRNYGRVDQYLIANGMGREEIVALRARVRQE